MAYQNDNDANDYAEEEGKRRYERLIQRRLVNRDPFYPNEYHRQDVLSGIVDISEEE